MFFLVLGLLLSADSSVKVETRTHYQIDLDDKGVFVQDLGVFTMDKAGNLYGLDRGARKVYRWDSKGQFVSMFGNSGNGPGEFAFEDKKGSSYTMTFLKGSLLLANGLEEVLSLYTPEGKFIKNIRYPSLSGRLRRFMVTGDNHILLLQEQSFDPKPFAKLHLFSSELEKVKVLSHMPLKTYIPKFRGGELDGFLVNAFWPKINFYADPSCKYIIVGTNERPSFDILDFQGNKIRTVTHNIPMQDVDPKYIKEHKKASRSRNYEVIYPKKMPFSADILPLAKDRFFILNSSPISRTVDGWLLGNDGKPLGRVHFVCGESGTLNALQGRLIRLQEDEDGEYALQEITLVP